MWFVFRFKVSLADAVLNKIGYKFFFSFITTHFDIRMRYASVMQGMASVTLVYLILLNLLTEEKRT